MARPRSPGCPPPSYPLHDKYEAFLRGHAFLPTVQNPKTFVEVGHVPDSTLRVLSVENLLLELNPREGFPHLGRVEAFTEKGCGGNGRQTRRPVPKVILTGIMGT